MILESVHEPAFSLANVLFLASFAGNAINDVRARTGHIDIDVDCHCVTLDVTCPLVSMRVQYLQ